MADSEAFAVMLAPVDASYGRSNAPTRLHDSEASARAEAERLCRKEGKRFIVLRAVGFVAPAEAPLTWSEGVPDVEALDLPF